METPVHRPHATVAFAPTPRHAVDLLLRHAGFDAVDSRAAIVAPAPPLPPYLRRIVDAAEAAVGAGAQVSFRPGVLVALAALDRRWREVRLPDGSERFETVRAPAALLAAPAIALTAIAPGAGGEDSPVGLLAGLAHPRNRLAAAMGRDPALQAELASAIPVRTLLAAGTFDDGGVAFSAPDLVTAQLLWAALARRDDDGNPERQVAWERPEVQRSMMLGGGPRRPQDLTIRLAVDPAVADRGAAMSDWLRAALGPVAVEPLSG